MPDVHPDLPILDELGTALRTAFAEAATDAAGEARSPAPRRRWARRPTPWRLFGAGLLVAALGTGTAAATLTVLRGSPIPAPRPADLQPLMTAEAATQQVLPLRSPDPAGGPSYALRTGRSRGGLTCVTVGQVEGDRFGLVGSDGAFRTMPATVVDSCGTAAPGMPALLGTRILDDPDPQRVRTVLYGIGSPGLQSATAIVRGRDVPLALHDRAFLLTVAGYPEDDGLAVRLRYRGGRATEHDLGRSDRVALDQAGGAAWNVDVAGPSRSSGLADGCVVAIPVRYVSGGPGGLPAICGTRDRGRPWLFDIRSFRKGMRSPKDVADRLGHGRIRGVRGGFVYPSIWDWRSGAPRTVVWGYASPQRVKRVVVVDGERRYPATPSRTGAFAVIMPPTISAGRATVELQLRDGSVRRFDHPVLARGEEHAP